MQAWLFAKLQRISRGVAARGARLKTRAAPAVAQFNSGKADRRSADTKKIDDE
jgi:hypothetical protein